MVGLVDCVVSSMSTSPLISTASLISTMPPVESSIRLPDVVSTVLVSILTLSMVALPVTVTTPTACRLSTSVCPSTSKSTPTERVDPLNVKLASSSSAPALPAITTRLSVKSATVADERLI